MKKFTFSILSFKVIIALTVMILYSCNNGITITPTAKPYGYITDTSNCKKTVLYEKALTDTNSTDDCIDYQWDGKGTLTFKHINAEFNCCHDSINADIDFGTNYITITEKEYHPNCYCNCLFDINYAIRDLNPGTYILTINEPYRDSSATKLQLTLELGNTELSDIFCVPGKNIP